MAEAEEKGVFTELPEGGRELEASLKVEAEKHLGEAVTNLLLRRTPDSVVKTRRGRGKQTFQYVPIAWFIDQLNVLFGFNWDFEIIEHGLVKDKHIWVKGKLTVRTSDGTSIVKTQFGSSELKLAQQTSNIIDYGDDLKAAASDCLKKCATLIGLAWDVYSGERESLTAASPNINQLLAFYNAGKAAGMGKDAVDEWYTKQTDINPEGKDPDHAVQAEVLGAIGKLRTMEKKEGKKE